ncbi:glycosyltransferase family 4 protein [Paenibacillus amylolyticus]|uniref:glycosyltransferase family 4 protein n=1 Tax=Paenibacillus TaxID=44249 RepID=UPI0030D9937B
MVKVPPIRIFVSDIQPILPSIAGGRLRLAGIWGNIPDGFQLDYVGTFDNAKQKKTIKKFGSNSTEILVPCSDEHFSKLLLENASFPSLNLFDIAFHRFVHLSDQYILESVSYMKDADIVIFSHPWSYRVLKPFIDTSKQTIVYDSQNVESFLRAEDLLSQQYKRLGSQLLREIIEIENELLQDADLILTCSKRDFDQFITIYGVKQDKLLLTPNGVSVKKSTDHISATNKKRMKKKWGLKRKYNAVFSGSYFGPNVRALKYINKIASLCPEIDFLVTGDLNDVIKSKDLSENVHLLGLLNEKKLKEVYDISDVGLNPIEIGSGSNIKVFTYMEAGLTVVSTPFGARGIDVLDKGFYEGKEAIVIAELEVFVDKLKDVLNDENRRIEIAAQGQKMVKSHYSWKEISERVCQVMKSRFQL